jgi:hypothetical protein
MVEIISLSYGLGLKFLVDFHTPFGGVVQSYDQPPVHQVFLSQSHENLYASDLMHIAKQIEGHPGIFGLEIFNEPHCRVNQWTKFLRRSKDWLNACTTHPKYISSVYGDPKLLSYLPRLGKGFRKTAHFWPAPLSLIGAGGFLATGKEEQIIKNGTYLKSLRHIKENSTSRRKVFLGEVGCTRGIGDALQKEYMRKTLKYCLKNKMDVLVHGEAGNPHYAYEKTGVLEVVAELFGGTYE